MHFKYTGILRLKGKAKKPIPCHYMTGISTLRHMSIRRFGYECSYRFIHNNQKVEIIHIFINR